MNDTQFDRLCVAEVYDHPNEVTQFFCGFGFVAGARRAIQSLKSGSHFEVGVAYSRLFNVMDTTNYNEDSADAVPFKRKPGSFEDDIDALSLFFGLQIPL